MNKPKQSAAFTVKTFGPAKQAPAKQAPAMKAPAKKASRDVLQTSPPYFADSAGKGWKPVL